MVGAILGVLTVAIFVLAVVVQYRVFPPTETMGGQNDVKFALGMQIGVEATAVVPAALTVLGLALGAVAGSARRWCRCWMA